MVVSIQLTFRQTTCWTKSKQIQRPFSRCYCQSEKTGTIELSQQLLQLDELLSSDNAENEEKAIKFMENLVQEKAVKGFGQGRQLPKRIYTLEELKLNSIQPEKLLSPKDDTIIMLRNAMRVAFLVGVVSLNQVFDGDLFRTLTLSFGGLLTFLWFDQAITGGGLETLLLDTVGRKVLPEYRNRVALHESGHFLIAYLIGLLPKAYTLSTLDAFKKYGLFNVQAGCRFCDNRFNSEVQSGKLSASSLSQYACVALAGVATESERFGHSEGGLADIQQLDQLLSALKFTQQKADGEIRWAVLNVIFLLRRHKAVHTQLAQQMDQGNSVGQLIAFLENQFKTVDDI